MTISSWHLSCTVLLGTLFVGEFLLPAYFVRVPFIEIMMLTFSSLWCMNAMVSRNRMVSEISNQKADRRIPKKDTTKMVKEDVVSIPSKQEVVLKPVTPRQLMLQENTLSFERNIMGYLLQQLERGQFHNEFWSLQDMTRLTQAPEEYLRLELWPVVTFPQQKRLRYRVCAYKLGEGEDKTIPSLGGVADLLISLVITHMVNKHDSAMPPMMDFPVTALDYPKVVQYLFDCLDKKDSLLHKVLWLTSDLHNERHRLIWQRLKELGVTFAECVSFPQTNITSAYAHMTWDVFSKHLETEKKRKKEVSMQDFISQNVHIILGNVPADAQLQTAFDSVYGSFVGNPIILGGVENTRRMA